MSAIKWWEKSENVHTIFVAIGNEATTHLWEKWKTRALNFPRSWMWPRLRLRSFAASHIRSPAMEQRSRHTRSQEPQTCRGPQICGPRMPHCGDLPLRRDQRGIRPQPSGCSLRLCLRVGQRRNLGKCCWQPMDWIHSKNNWVGNFDLVILVEAVTLLLLTPSLVHFPHFKAAHQLLPGPRSKTFSALSHYNFCSGF